MNRPILSSVARRLTAFAIAAFVAAAPAALNACELVCAAQEAATETVEHSCHGPEPQESTARIAAAPHLCGHVEGLPPASGQLKKDPSAAAPFVAATALIHGAVVSAVVAPLSLALPPLIAAQRLQTISLRI